MITPVMKTTVSIYHRLWDLCSINKREEWFYERELGLTYVSTLEGQAAAEEAFHLTNAPEEYLTEEQQDLLKMLSFKGPSLSVGDVVRVEAYPKFHSTPADYYLCKSFGWEKFEGNVIELLKHLSW